jgi:chromosome partitioning protein
MAAKIISVVNAKGGTAKSTTAYNVGAALVELGKRVLMVDADPGAGLTGMAGIDPSSIRATTYHLMMEREAVDYAALPIATKTGAYLIPSNWGLAVAENELAQRKRGEYWHHQLKIGLQIYLKQYDFILVDCGPSFGNVVVNALFASSRAIVPVVTQYMVLGGLVQLEKIIEGVQGMGNAKLEMKILPVMHDARTVHGSEILAQLEKIFKGRIYQAVIKKTVRFCDASLSGDSILTYDSESDVANEYRRVAQEVLNDG